MSVATDFRTWLLTNTSLTAKVGDRICQLYVQQPKCLPYVMFRRSGRRDDGMDLDGDSGVDVTTLDVEVCGERGHDVDAIADLIRDAANGFPQATLTGSSRKWNGRTIQFVEVSDANDDYEFMPPAADQIERTVALILEVASDG